MFSGGKSGKLLSNMAMAEVLRRRIGGGHGTDRSLTAIASVA
jgi:hypothetical protein